MTDRGNLSPHRPTQRVLGENFLSVDVDAQLRKLPSQTFRSAHHYPVELVRGAAGRGAGRIELTIARKELVVTDDGAPMSLAALSALVLVVDPSRSQEDRERALAFFEDGNGMDVLAALAPAPRRVWIETGPPGARIRVMIETGKPAQTWPPSLLDRLRDGSRLPDWEEVETMIAPGRGESASGHNRVRIERKGKQKAEREALADYCCYAKSDIILDGRRVSSRGPAGALAYADLPAGDGIGPGRVWIPREGDTCRVTLLSHGIRWRQSAYPPRKGLIYHAAVDAVATPPTGTIERIRENAHQLYGLLAKRHRGLETASRRRVEELLFLHYRLRGESDLVGGFAPFRLLGSKRLLSLSEVAQEAQAGELRMLNVGERAERFDVRVGPVLLVTAPQREFLLHQVGLLLPPPPRKVKDTTWPIRLSRLALAGLRALVGGVSARVNRPIPEGRLEPDEIRLLELVRQELNDGGYRLPLVPAAYETDVCMVNRAGARPGALLRHRRAVRLVLFRRHKDLRACVTACADHPENIRMVMPLLCDGHDGAVALLPPLRSER